MIIEKIRKFYGASRPHSFSPTKHQLIIQKKITSSGILQSRRTKRSLTVTLIFGLLMALGCQDNRSSGNDTATVKTYFPLKIGLTSLQAQIAIHPHELQQGLMFRNHMEADNGMLFVFKVPQRLSFYMRNTKIPLDIGYFTADGTLKEIYPMYPEDETPIRSISHSVQFALEMNQGWFARHKIVPEVKLDLNAIQKSFKARGIDANPYSLPIKSSGQ
jgi:uncharacterized membrane protein (UPF0127 family)